MTSNPSGGMRASNQGGMPMIVGTPYDGVSAVASAWQLRRMQHLEQAALLLYEPSPRLAITAVKLLVTPDTARGTRAQVHNPGLYAAMGEIPRIRAAMRPDDVCMLSCVWDDERRLASSFAAMVAAAGIVPHGVQMNLLTGPPPEELVAMRAQLVECGSPGWLEMQVHPGLTAGREPDALADWLEPYVATGALSHVLWDGSCGGGRLLDPFEVARYLVVLARRFPDLALGASGGLCASTASVLVPLFVRFPRLNVDAEGRLVHPITRLLWPEAAVAYRLAVANARREAAVRPHW